MRTSKSAAKLQLLVDEQEESYNEEQVYVKQAISSLTEEKSDVRLSDESEYFNWN